MKAKDIKSRLDEILQLRIKLKELGIHNNIEFKDLYEEMQDFIKTGNSYSGSIRIKQIGKKIIYNLTNNKNIISNITIKSLN